MRPLFNLNDLIPQMPIFQIQPCNSKDFNPNKYKQTIYEPQNYQLAG